MRQIIDTVKGGAHAPSDCFVNPTFQQIVGTTSKGGTAFEGVMTFGNLREPGVALQGRVYRKADELLIVGHYDVTEFAWLNNELAQSNREVNTLHRALIQEKRRLAEPLSTAAFRLSKIIFRVRPPKYSRAFTTHR